jgi:hypothetical protein
MFHQVSNIDSLNQLWNYSSSFTFKQDYKLFPGDLSKFCLKCLHCGKRITPYETLRKILFIAPMATTHHLKILSSVSVVNDSSSMLKKCQSYLPRQEIIQHQKNRLESQFTKWLEMTMGFYCSKKSCTSHDDRIGECSFCEAI